MINAFYNGLSGAKSFQGSLDIKANNISNVYTAGYKTQEVAFSDLIYSDISTKNSNGQLKIGNGVKLSGMSSQLSQGTIEETGKKYDFTIMGQGYFAVRSADDQLYYTRNGNFHIEEKDGDTYLLTANGDNVLDGELSPLTIKDVANDNPDENSDISNEAGELAVFTFKNPNSLTREGYGRLSANDLSGQAEILDKANIIQGVLEGSNVDMVKEMTDMMEAQRGFQFSTKLIQTADELENIANTLR